MSVFSVFACRPACHSASIALLGVFLLTACQTDVPSAPPPRVPTARLAVSPSGGAPYETLNDHLAALSDSVPGFAGMRPNADGGVTMYLTAAGDPATAVPATAAFYAQHALEMNVVPSVLQNHVTIQRVRYTFRQLYDWYGGLTHMLGIPGIVLSGIDPATNQVTIGVRNTATAKRVGALANASGIPDAALKIAVTSPFRMTASLQGTLRPTWGGAQVSSLVPGLTCSLGYNLRAFIPLAHQFYLTPDYFMLPAHCTATFGVTEGTMVGQPNALSVIGHEVYDPPLYTGSGCPAGRQCQNQDAAIFQYNAGVSDGFQKVAHAFNGSPTLYPGSFLPPASYTVVYYENLNNVSPPNGLVYKVGRTTGETATNIANVSFCLDLVLYNQSGNDTGITLRCQSTATLPSQAGDSGAPVYISAGPGGVITGVGMVWGANGSGVTSFSSNLRQMLAIFSSAYFPGNTYEFAPTP